MPIKEKIANTYVSAKLNSNGRNGGIRTHDLLVPNQTHYQAVLRPEFSPYKSRRKLLYVKNQRETSDLSYLNLSKRLSLQEPLTRIHR